MQDKFNEQDGQGRGLSAPERLVEAMAEWCRAKGYPMPWDDAEIDARGLSLVELFDEFIEATENAWGWADRACQIDDLNFGLILRQQKANEDAAVQATKEFNERTLRGDFDAQFDVMK